MKPLFFLLLLATAACAPTHFVRPLAARQQAVSLAVGGPLIAYGNTTIPIPFITATYGYGLDSTLTGFGSVNITSALFGNAQLELGLTKQLVRPLGWRPGLSVSPVANVVYRSTSAARFYPQLDINAFWDYGRRNYVYVGLSNWLELAGTRTLDQPQPHHWLFSPMLGTALVRQKWDFLVEAKVIAPNIRNDFNTAEYQTPFGTHGALGVYVGLTRKF